MGLHDKVQIYVLAQLYILSFVHISRHVDTIDSVHLYVDMDTGSQEDLMACSFTLRALELAVMELESVGVFTCTVQELYFHLWV